jgi:DNA-binding phage protein
LGTAEAIEELMKRYGPAGKREEVPAFAQARRETVKAEVELSRVAEAFGVKQEELMRRRRNFMPRLAAYYHLVEHCGLGATEMGTLMGVRPAAISMGVSRFMRRLQQEPDLKKRMESLSVK